MNVAFQLMTVDAFLQQRPETADPLGKWELVGGLPVFCQAEGGLHARVKANALVALDGVLPPGGPCLAYVDGPAVRIDEKTAYIPDLAVNCSDGIAGLEYDNPVLVVEVAVSTLARDMGEKAAAYFRNLRVCVYMVLDAVNRAVWIWRRGVEAPERVVEGTAVLTIGGAPVRLEVGAFWRHLPPHKP